MDQNTGRPYPPDLPLAEIRTNGGHSHLEWLRKATPGREPTVADLGRLTSRRHARLVGTPDQIADGLENWRAAGIDGVNLINWMIPGSYEEYNAHVLPTLQKRGLAKREYADGSLRAKMFGSDRLNERHPAIRYKGAFSSPAKVPKRVND